MMVQQQTSFATSHDWHGDAGTAVMERAPYAPARSMTNALEFTTLLPARPAPVIEAENEPFDCSVLMARLETEFPEWFDAFAPADMDMGAWNELAELSKTAPHKFLEGVATGKLTERMAISVVTGRQAADFTPFVPAFLGTQLAAQLESDHGEWFDACSHVEADNFADVDEAMVLVNTAPHPYFAGALYGRLAARTEYRMIAGC